MRCKNWQFFHLRFFKKNQAGRNGRIFGRGKLLEEIPPRPSKRNRGVDSRVDDSWKIGCHDKKGPVSIFCATPPRRLPSLDDVPPSLSLVPTSQGFCSARRFAQKLPPWHHSA